MTTYLNITAPAALPEFGRAWRAADGTPRASVSLGPSWIEFSGPAEARALAAECLTAAEEMEALPPAAGGGS